MSLIVVFISGLRRVTDTYASLMKFQMEKFYTMKIAYAYYIAREEAQSWLLCRTGLVKYQTFKR